MLAFEKEQNMEHHPFLSFENGLEITYSDIKKKLNGTEYITVYFEQPDEAGTDFKSAQCNFPGGSFVNVVGYSDNELDALWEHMAKAGPLAFEFERDPKYA